MPGKIRFNTDLVDDLARRKVILFLGAGVSASAVTATKGRIAGWEAFLLKAADKLPSTTRKQVVALIRKSKDYLLACEILQSALDSEWVDIVAEEFGQVAPPSALHKSLLSLRQRIVITTNFDKIFENAWGDLPEVGTYYPTVISAIDQDVFRILKDHKKSYVLKIHESVDDPKSMIFSRSEYIRMAFGNVEYSSFIENLLLNYTFMYVGFSMDDPAITSLMEMYALRYPTARPHYFVTPAGVPDNIAGIHKRLRKLVVMPYSGPKDHSGLPKMLDELVIAVNQARKEIMAADLASLSSGSSQVAYPHLA